MSVPNPEQRTILTHCLQIPLRLLVPLHDFAISLFSGIINTACQKRHVAINGTALCGVTRPSQLHHVFE
jgi:hypothetical protein